MTKLAFVDTETTGLTDAHEVWEVALIVRDSVEMGYRDPGGGAVYAHPPNTEYLWQLPVDLGQADPYALDIGRFRERRWPTKSSKDGSLVIQGLPRATGAEPIDRIIHLAEMSEWAERFAHLTWGAHWVGAVPSFDEQRLSKLLRANGACPGWHYHIVDVEALAMGYLHGLAKGIALTCPSDVQARDMPGVHGIGSYQGPLEAKKHAVPPWKSEELSKALGVNPDRFDKHTALGDVRWAMAIYDKVMGVSGG